MGTTTSRNFRLLSTTLLISMTVAILGLLGLASVAQAGLRIEGPVGKGAVNVNNEGKWRFKIAASCPAGKTCGGAAEADGGIVPGKVFFELRHNSIKGADYEDFFKNGFWYRDVAGGEINAKTVLVDSFKGEASGRWTISTYWHECPLPTYPFETAENPCKRERVTSAVTIRPTIFEPRATLQGVPGKPRLGTTGINFYRNAPRGKYRVKVVVQRRVRSKGRTRWVKVASRANRRIAKPTFSSNLLYSHVTSAQVPLPKRLPDSARLRSRIIVTTTGMKPAMKRRVFTTAVTTRGTIRQQSGGGGSIIIGS